MITRKQYPKRKVVKVLPQSGKPNDILADLARKALAPGKRVSKTGKTYWETRINRSDRVNRNI